MMNNGYQPKKKGDGKPPAPPTTGSNAQSPAPSNKTIIESNGVVILALEKQIPQKPKMVGDNYASSLCCPSCNQPIINVWNNAEYKPNYCHYCGQRLDWSK